MALADTFYVAPSPLLVLWSLLVFLSIPAGGVTALKGRWGWLVAGFLTIGLLWLISAFLPAAADSWWARRRGSPAD